MERGVAGHGLITDTDPQETTRFKIRLTDVDDSPGTTPNMREICMFHKSSSVISCPSTIICLIAPATLTLLTYSIAHLPLPANLKGEWPRAAGLRLAPAASCAGGILRKHESGSPFSHALPAKVRQLQHLHSENTQDRLHRVVYHR